MSAPVLATLLAAAAIPLVGVEFFPLARIQPGMKAVGRTVFSGEKVEEFQAEILGVLENVGPRQSLILARLTGGPLAKTGVLAGMSGSPIYIEGKLVGAVAFGFPFATEAIAGIRPIGEMIEAFEQRADPPPSMLRAALAPGFGGDRWIPRPQTPLLPPGPEPAPGRLVPIATPIHFSGFTARTLEVFGGALREMGLEPMQGTGGASRAASSEMADASKLEPGAMISVGLIRGDFSVNADGALTHVDGRRIYGFGHRLLSSGPTDLPLMKASVVALLPSVNNSFKISKAGDLIGAIRQDRTAGIYGELGMQPRLIPVEVNVYSSRSGAHRYQMEVVRDRFLTPFLLQIAVFSAVDATERALGPSTLEVRGRIEFGPAAPAVELDNLYAGEANLTAAAAMGAALPMAHLLQSGFAELRVERVRLDIRSTDEKKQLRVERAWSSTREARAGETVELAAALRGEDGREVIRKARFEIPAGTSPGPLQVTFADGNWMNLLDLQGGGAVREATSGAQLVRAINQTRRNNRLYARVWRPERAFLLQGEALPSPPASLKSVLGSAGGPVGQSWTATLAEMEIGGFDTVISGSSTIRIAVRE